MLVHRAEFLETLSEKVSALSCALPSFRTNIKHMI
jgi:hypothetical protein